MKTLTADEILSANDLTKELVPVPEWGGNVYIKAMTGFERDAFEEGIAETKDGKPAVNLKNIRAKLVALTACDETGVLLFEHKHVKKLGEKSAKALDRCFAVAQRLNGLSNDDVEKLAKN